MRYPIFIVLFIILSMGAPDSKSAAEDSIFDDITALVQQGVTIVPAFRERDGTIHQGTAQLSAVYKGIQVKIGDHPALLTNQYDAENGGCVLVTCADGLSYVAKDPMPIILKKELSSFTLLKLYQVTDGTSPVAIDLFQGMDLAARKTVLDACDDEEIKYKSIWRIFPYDKPSKWGDHALLTVPFLTTTAWWLSCLMAETKLGVTENVLWGLTTGVIVFGSIVSYKMFEEFSAFEKLKHYWLQDPLFIKAIMKTLE
tara:strand:- start:23328 stop:24095 length:768 start_codon:yes stop_codon:yes gene_type:complete